MHCSVSFVAYAEGTADFCNNIGQFQTSLGKGICNPEDAINATPATQPHACPHDARSSLRAITWVNASVAVAFHRNILHFID
jgi:hypothetical protein